MDQWNNGGAPNFIPLKEWRTKFLPEAWRGAANESYRTREIIAKKALTYPNVEAFVRAYPNYKSMIALRHAIVEENNTHE
jgi:hypothetical protein